MIARLMPGDALVVWDLDRAYRSTRDALNELDALQRRGIDFMIANLKVDTASPEGYFVYTIMSANSEFERRTKEGLAVAKLRGQTLGRPRKLSHRQVVEAKARLAARQTTITALAKEYEVGRWTLSRALNRMENG